MKQSQINKFIGKKVKIVTTEVKSKTCRTIIGVIEQNTDGWYKIYSDYKYLFINAEYIKKIKLIY